MADVGQRSAATILWFSDINVLIHQNSSLCQETSQAKLYTFHTQPFNEMSIFDSKSHRRNNVNDENCLKM